MPGYFYPAPPLSGVLGSCCSSSGSGVAAGVRWAAVSGAVVGVVEMPLAAGLDRVAAARAEHPTLFDVGEPLSAESGVALAVATCVGCAAPVFGDAASLAGMVDSAAYVAGSRQAHRDALSSRMVVVVLGVIVGTVVGLVGECQLDDARNGA
jgi:hypothetical protein